jgi:hypothetical protein
MSAQEAKVRHQKNYQQEVEAIRSGKIPGRVMVRPPAGIIQCKNARKIQFFLNFFLPMYPYRYCHLTIN